MSRYISLLHSIYEKFMDKYYESDVHKKYFSNITLNENRYLDIINTNEKITLSEFANKARVTKPAATQIINKFIDKNYVIKIQSEEDKRIYYIELTPKIKEYFLESYKEESEIYKKYLDFLSKEEVDTLIKILTKIDKNM